VEAVCTSATSIGEVVSEVISQAAATSFIHIEMLAASQVNHNIRNTGMLKGARAEECVESGVGESVAGESFGIGDQDRTARHCRSTLSLASDAGSEIIVQRGQRA